MIHKTTPRRRRLIGMGFVIAFVLSTATIIYTGLNVRAPGTAADAPPPDASAQQSESPSADTEQTAEDSGATPQ